MHAVGVLYEISDSPSMFMLVRFIAEWGLEEMERPLLLTLER
jgi:hypothetical protein